MASESNLGYSNAPGTENLFIVPLPVDGRTSSRLLTFENVPLSLAVPHMIGCTSVIVVSQKGAWASHFWDAPAFRPEEAFDNNTKPIGWYTPGYDPNRTVVPDFPYKQQRTFFRENVLDRLHTRYNPVTEEHESGLDILRQGSGLFNDSSEYRVFLFGPYPTIVDENDPNFNNESPDLPANWDHPGGPTPRADENQTAFNDQIRAELRTIFNNRTLEIHTVLYAPDEVQDDPEDSAFDNPRGRALTQYKPGISGNIDSTARWRIWFEREQTSHDHAYWTPLRYPAQRCLP